MNRSSIFSFDTLRQWPRPTGAALFAIALCICARLLIGAVSDRMLVPDENSVHDLYIGMELRHRASKQPSPTVVILGTSRLDKVEPAQVAQSLEIPASGVVNYSSAGGNFWRSLVLVRRNPEAVAHARYVVIDLLPFQVFRTELFPENDKLFLQMATLEERTEVLDLPDRMIALADAAYPAWSKTRRVRNWRRGFEQFSWHSASRLDFYLESPDRRATAGPDLGVDEGSKLSDLLGGAIGKAPAFSTIAAQSVYRLADELPDGCTLVLIWLPVRDDFAAALGREPLKTSYDQFRDFFQRVDHPKIRVVWYPNGTEAGFSGSDYMDAVHFNYNSFARVIELVADACEYSQARR